MNLQSEGHLAEAEAVELDLLDRYRKTSGPDNADMLASMNNLAIVYGMENKLAAAETMLGETLAGCLRVLGPDE